MFVLTLGEVNSKKAHVQLRFQRGTSCEIGGFAFR